MEIEETIIDIVHRVLKKHGISRDMIAPDKSIVDDLKAESLDIIEMMLTFEETFDVSIADEEIVGIRTIEDLYRKVNNLLENQNHLASNPQ